MSRDVLSLFHPQVGQWFETEFGNATSVQALTWPVVAAGQHVLVTAPTGTGKTLSAFMWALNQLITERWEGGCTRVLYVSPLKALNADIRRNLLTPLTALRDQFSAAGMEMPAIDVQTRSGDTPSSQRQRMLKRPPEILITTPESLNILLTTPNGRMMLSELKTVILDEIHAVVGGKRGTHLITAIDRLVPLAGEFQRIALSATVRPLELVSRFVGGYQNTATGTTPREVVVVQSPDAKQYELAVTYPEHARDDLIDGSRWPILAKAMGEQIQQHQSTLLFTNNRRLCERLTLMLKSEAEVDAYAHHGSLARELRQEVEQKLKNGELPAIVATSSLELGIDIGALEQVILVQTPTHISSAIQRLGRAGHAVGMASKGTLYPTHGRDFLEAAVLARAVLDQDIEAVQPIEQPLDMLAQIIVSMAAGETLSVDGIYDVLRTSYPFRDLSRRFYELVLDMLSGRYATTRLRELQPRIAYDRLEQTVRTLDGAVHALFLSGGTIPDRGYFALRLQDSHSKIGELDEEFVWERRIGDTFVLGTQAWRITGITDSDVLVAAGDPRQAMTPFWRAEDLDRSFHFAEKIGEFLESVDGRVDEPELQAELQCKHHMAPPAVAELVEFLKRQRTITGVPLPHRHHIVVEILDQPDRATATAQIIIHTQWGGRVNRPLAAAISAAYEQRFQLPLETFANNDAVVAMLPHDQRIDLLSLVTPESVENLVQASLEQTGFFAARFRENAERALLLTRKRFNQRLPLWLNRLRSRKLMEAVADAEDFPILLETWRTAMNDEFEVARLKRLLAELASGDIRVSECRTRTPSPFAGNIVFYQVNKYMYFDDTPFGSKSSSTKPDLITALLGGEADTLTLDPDALAALTGKLQRTEVGYAPRPGLDLLEWVKQRLVLPVDEWHNLLTAIARDHDEAEVTAIQGILAKLRIVRFAKTKTCCVTSLECLEQLQQLTRLACWSFAAEDGRVPSEPPTDWRCESSAPAPLSGDAWGRAATPFLAQFLQFYGPVPRAFIGATFGWPNDAAAPVLDALLDARTLVHGSWLSDDDICDADNFERLLRLQRIQRRPAFEALPIKSLPLFIATHQGLTQAASAEPRLEDVLDPLLGYPLPAAAWERHVLPSRLAGYHDRMLDALMTTSDLMWIGSGKGQLFPAMAPDLDLFPPSLSTSTEDMTVSQLLPKGPGRFNFAELSAHTALTSAKLGTALWESVWTGAISNDSFAAIREGIRQKFTVKESASSNRRGGRRGGFNRWRSSRTLSGNWFAVPWPDPSDDLLVAHDRNRERVHQLLMRYGILFRELLAHELPALRWQPLLNTMRLMELAGELISGHFFTGINGMQFITPQTLASLAHLDKDAHYWLAGNDPASLCGCGPPALKSLLPKRSASNIMRFHGSTLVVLASRSGKELQIEVAPDCPELSDYLAFLRVLLNNADNQKLIIESINNEPPERSPYLPCLQSLFDVTVDYRRITLWRPVGA